MAHRNYLRVRGEYAWNFIKDKVGTELPPRARRILQSTIFCGNKQGTTSACAENTRTQLCRSTRPGNYLRVRGEYSPRSGEQPDPGELPPRARRIQNPGHKPRASHGTTSACAENTGHGGHRFQDSWNYLRVRGEYACLDRGCLWGRELPPRARRIL